MREIAYAVRVLRKKPPFAISAVVCLGLAIGANTSVIAYSVSRRTREFGIRLAIGATSSNVVWHVMADGSGVLMTAAAAMFVPARRASRVDPVIALRQQ